MYFAKQKKKIDVILEYINSDDHINAALKYIFCFKHTHTQAHLLTTL